MTASNIERASIREVYGKHGPTMNTFVVN